MFCVRRKPREADSRLPVALPPPPSSTGKRYYLLRDQPVVCCGKDRTLEEIGSWFGAGTAPKGFADLEAAVSAAATKFEAKEVVIYL